MSKQDFLELLDIYLAGNASADQEMLLFDIYKRIEDKYEWTLAEMETLDRLEHVFIEKFKNSLRKLDGIDLRENKNIIKHRFYNRAIFQIAASLLVLLTAALWYMQYHSAANFEITNALNHDSKELISNTNNTNGIEKIIFPDKSCVELTRGSKVVYSKNFSGSLRQVYLTGEGFFMVTKNHAKPFIVYTDKIVAKVLGTSFIVKSGLNNTEACVVVKTGKVAVFKTKDFTTKNTKANFKEGILVLPNQLADLNSHQLIEKKLSKSPEILNKSALVDFDFDNTPIADVFSKLQENYGITIIYDKVKFGTCSISVDMGKEGFYQKLDLICRTINASYQIIDGNVVITGVGCKN